MEILNDGRKADTTFGQKMENLEMSRLLLE